MIDLRIELAKPVLQVQPDGVGYETRRVGNHRANLHVGNVSLAFDGRNNWDGRFDVDREVIELSEYHDDPVRLGSVSCPGGDSVAETLLFALAADLGYTVCTGDCDD